MLHPNATWCQVRLASAVSLTSSNSGIKAELEEAVSTMPFEAVHIFRPGLLLGHRNESQPAESLVAKLAPLSTLVRSLREYRPEFGRLSVQEDLDICVLINPMIA